MKAAKPRLLLASSSTARRRMFVKAGLRLGTTAHGLDETELKKSLSARGWNVQEAVLRLAAAKAAAVSTSEGKTAHVIGGDQILECEGTWFDKPENLREARRQLENLCGKKFLLHSAVAVACGGEVLWCCRREAGVTMRRFSPAYLGRYLASCDPEVFSVPGACMVEGTGAQLLESVEGDIFTVLGLPLLPLLAWLRARGLLES